MEITVEVSGYQSEQVAREYLSGAMPSDQISVITEELSPCELEELYKELHDNCGLHSDEDIAVKYLENAPSKDQITAIKRGLTIKELDKLLRSAISTMGAAEAMSVALHALQHAVDNTVERPE